MTPEAEKYRERLRAMLPELRERFGVAALGLFGSRVRGDHRPDSDLDVLVAFEPGRTPGLRYFDLADEIGRRLGLTVDLVPWDALRPAVEREVNREVARV
jgi:uncharacterized protein